MCHEAPIWGSKVFYNSFINNQLSQCVLHASVRFAKGVPAGAPCSAFRCRIDGARGTRSGKKP